MEEEGNKVGLDAFTVRSQTVVRIESVTRATAPRE
jgi:hypothetical protein